MTGWPRGAVAMVSAANRSEPYPASYDGRTWRSLDGGFCVDQPTSHRALVVIDPEARGVAVEIAQAVGSVLAQPGQDISRAIEAVQRHLRSLVADPRPEEPEGLGAVVEDERGEKWLRHDHALVRRWLNTADCEIRYRAYDEINAVRVLSAGWSE